MQHPLASALFLAPLLCAACGGGTSGTVVVAGGSPPPPLIELEPNDNALQADCIGEVFPGDRIEIEGHITECCPDPYDGFAFYAAGPVELVLTLFEDSPTADLDLAIYDPGVDAVIQCWETDSHPETGVFRFAGGAEIHVVLHSFIGDSSYLLRVDVNALPQGAALFATQGSSASAQRRFAGYTASAHAPRLERVELSEVP